MKYGKLTLGQIEAIVNKLGGEEGVKAFLAGHSEVVIKKHLIDLDATPFVPEGWTVEDHRKGGQFEWEASKVALHLDKGQKNGIMGNELRKKLANPPVLNANVLDYLLKHPHLIPEEWKDKYIFFWGTIYRYSVGGLCVRCLGWGDGRWGWRNGWLDGDWGGSSPAAVLASA